MTKNLKSPLVEGKTTQERVPTRRGRGDTELVLRPTGPSNEQVLRSVIREWLVPRLVDEFLGERCAREADTSQDQSTEAEQQEIGN